MIADQVRPTHMALETAQAPQAVARMLAANRPLLREVGKLIRSRSPSHLITCARGSSDHAASYLKYLSEIVLGIPCCSVGASVVSIFGARLRLRDTLLISVSQSGRSPDILAFQEEAKRAGVPAIALTNDENSPLASGADICLPLLAGPELSVAATKTFISSAVLLAALVAASGEDERFNAAIENLPDDLRASGELNWPDFEGAASKASSLYVLGRGYSLPMAEEAALKLKETCAIHSEAYSAAEIMHGPMELIQQGFPILVLSGNNEAEATTRANVERLEAAGANVFWPKHRETRHAALDPVTMIHSFYGSAERIAAMRGRNPDAPRLLKKVTETR